jgi:hypothetical protein
MAVGGRLSKLQFAKVSQGGQTKIPYLIFQVFTWLSFSVCWGFSGFAELFHGLDSLVGVEEHPRCCGCFIAGKLQILS